MATYTGIVGAQESQNSTFIEGAPSIFFQPIPDTSDPGVLHNPDSNGFYWGLTGTTAAPVYELGCYENVRLGDNIDINSIRCDKSGDQGAIRKRNYIEVSFTLKSLLPLVIARHLLNWSPIIENGNFEKTGIGEINNNDYVRAAMVRVYDPANSDYVFIQVHRGQFVQNSEIQFTYGQPWQVDVTLRGYADEGMPNNQLFATVIHHESGHVAIGEPPTIP